MRTMARTAAGRVTRDRVPSGPPGDRRPDCRQPDGRVSSRPGSGGRAGASVELLPLAAAGVCLMSSACDDAEPVTESLLILVLAVPGKSGQGRRGWSYERYHQLGR